MIEISQALLAQIEAERVVSLERYQEDGAECRFDYLQGLSEAHGLKLDLVLALAEMLGPDEDFDGLAVAVADAENYSSARWCN